MKFLIDGGAGIAYCDTGIGAYTETLIGGFSREHISPDSVAVLTDGKSRAVADYFSLPRKTLPTFWQTIGKQAETTLPPDFDLYHNTQNGIGMPRFAGRKIVTVHDLIPLIMPDYCGSPYKELFAENCLKNAGSAEAIITVSQQSKRDLVQYGGIAPEKITVIYEAPKTCFRQWDSAAGYLSAAYNIKPPFFLYVGGFNPRKNLAGIFTALNLFRQSHPDALLVIPAKASPRCRRYQEEAAKAGLGEHIRFPPAVSEKELSFFYNCCTALLYPSFYEGFGLPPLEAAACKAPTILSDLAVHREIMAEAAFYVDPYDPGSIAAAMAELWEDEPRRQQVAAAAWEQSRKYSPAKTVKQTLELYRKVCR